jgi:16S rRNA (guanine527-N7)-methyltransferase
MSSTTRLSAAAADLGLDLSAGQLDRLATYAGRLATSATNLVSARDRDQIEQRHLVESLAYGRLLEKQGLLPDGTRLLDLGAGGGLPGIPIKIAWPAVELTLLESVGKKCRFLEQVIVELGLNGTNSDSQRDMRESTSSPSLPRNVPVVPSVPSVPVTVLEGRAETLAHHPAHREHYDLVVARAVAALPVLVEYSLPFLRVGGHLAAVKGSTALDEIDAAQPALRELGGRLAGAPAFDPPQGPRQTVVIIEKTHPTPDRYPRREGIPAKRPLR